MPDDYLNTIDTAGSVDVGGTATGNIETARDQDWFAVELVAGRTYAIDLRGSPTGDGTLSDPLLRGLYDAEGNLISGTANDDGGEGVNSRVTFTATESGTYYIAAGAYSRHQGTYEVEVTDTSPAPLQPEPQIEETAGPVAADSGDVRANATDLGDITGLALARFLQGTLDADTGAANYYRFELTEAKQLGLGLRRLNADADLVLEDDQGNALHESRAGGTAGEWISVTLLAGTYYVRVEARESGANDYRVRYGVSDADPDEVARLEAASNEAPANEAPAFAQPAYDFALAENAPGSPLRVSLGIVSAADPEGATVEYSLATGNDAGLFEVDVQTGELFYTGAGEDYESGTTQFDLTVQASDATHSTDTAVTVNVDNVDEAPAFGQPDYEFSLAENADGSTSRISLGTVSAADPENATLEYSLVGGNSTGLFELEAHTGELFYTGAGEDYESGTTQFDLTVRASDATHSTDTAVTVNITDEQEQSIVEPPVTDTGQSMSEPDGEDLPANPSTIGRVAVGGIAAGSIETAGDRDWFAVELFAGHTYVINLKGSATDDGTLEDPFLRGLYDGAGNFIVRTRDNDGGEGRNSRVTYTATESGTYYISARGRGADTDTETGTYALRVTDTTPPSSAHADAADLGDITGLPEATHLTETLDADAGAVDYYRLELTEPKRLALSLRHLTADADLVIEDAQGRTLKDSHNGGIANEWLTGTFLAGIYYLRVNARQADTGEYSLRYGVTEANPGRVAQLEAAGTETPANDTPANEAPAFGQQAYDFALAEHAPGNTVRVPLGIVSADDPEGTTIEYSLTGSNDAGLFEIDPATGELFYIGSGEDYESGPTQFNLKVRASDGDLHSETTVTVNLNDMVEEETPSLPSLPMTGTPVMIVDYSDPKWVDESFDYGRSWGGRGFELAGSQRGAPEEIEIGQVDGVTALLFKSAERNQAWYDEHPEAVGHGEHGYQDSEPQDDFFFRNSDWGWTTGDNPYLIAQIHLGHSENITSLRMPAIFENDSGEEQRSWPGIFYVEGKIFLRGPGRGDISKNPPGHQGEGWVTLGMTVTDSGDLIYVGRLGNHSLTELFSDPDFEYHNSTVSTDRNPYFPAVRAGVTIGMFSQIIETDSPNAIAYIEYGTNLNLDRSPVNDSDVQESILQTVSELPGDDFSANISSGGRVVAGDAATGEIRIAGDLDWFAVELTKGHTYIIDLRGAPTDDRTLTDPYLRGIFDADGDLISDTMNDDGGNGYNSRVTFTAAENGIHYIAAGAYSSHVGTYELEVRDTNADDSR